jgi:hypothetical protein
MPFSNISHGVVWGAKAKPLVLNMGWRLCCVANAEPYLRISSGSLAKLTAMRRASSLVRRLLTARRDGSSSK